MVVKHFTKVLHRFAKVLFAGEVGEQVSDVILLLLLSLLKGTLVHWVGFNNSIIALKLRCDSILRPDVIVILQKEANVASQLLVNLFVQNLPAHIVERLR